MALLKKIFKIHTQESKVATYTSTSLKVDFLFVCLFVTMAHGITCTRFLGNKQKLGMVKEAYQDGYIKVRMILKGQGDMLHGLALL